MNASEAPHNDEQKLRHHLQHEWDRLNDADLDHIGSSRERLHEVLSSKYNLTHEAATNQINHFWTTIGTSASGSGG